MTISKVVFIHGWGLNSAIWEGVVSELSTKAPQLSVQLIDLPGYGAASQIKSSSDLSELAQHCLDQAHEPALWVGWSLGGMVAMQAALITAAQSGAGESNVQALQLINSSPKFVADFDWPVGVDLAVFQRFSDELAADYQRTLTMFLLLQAGANKGARDLARAAHTAICKFPDPSAATLQLGIDCLAEADLRAQMQSLDLPIQVMSGLRDRVAKPEAAKAMAGLVKAELLEFDTGHAPFMTTTDVYISSLLRFIERLNESG